MNYWYDSYNMLKPNPLDKNSGNGVLFTWEEDLADIYIKDDIVLFPIYTKSKFSDPTEWLIKLRVKWWEIIHDHCLNEHEYSQTPWQPQDPASRDNLFAIACASYALNLHFHRVMKIWGKVWLPGDIVFLKWIKNDCKGIWKYLLWINTIAMIISCLGSRRKTSTKLLLFIRLYSTHLPRTQKICEKILYKYYGVKYWYKMYKIYFPYPDHPTPIKIMKMHKQGWFLDGRENDNQANETTA